MHERACHIHTHHTVTDQAMLNIMANIMLPLDSADYDLIFHTDHPPTTIGPEFSSIRPFRICEPLHTGILALPWKKETPEMIMTIKPWFDVKVCRKFDPDVVHPQLPTKETLSIRIKPFIKAIYRRKNSPYEVPVEQIKAVYELPFTKPVSDSFDHIIINPDAVCAFEPQRPKDKEKDPHTRMKSYITQKKLVSQISGSTARILFSHMQKAGILHKTVISDTKQLQVTRYTPEAGAITHIRTAIQNKLKMSRQLEIKALCNLWFHNAKQVVCKQCGNPFDVNASIFNPVHRNGIFCTFCYPPSERAVKRMASIVQPLTRNERIKQSATTQEV